MSLHQWDVAEARRIDIYTNNSQGTTHFLQKSLYMKLVSSIFNLKTCHGDKGPSDMNYIITMMIHKWVAEHMEQIITDFTINKCKVKGTVPSRYCLGRNLYPWEQAMPCEQQPHCEQSAGTLAMSSHLLTAAIYMANQGLQYWASCLPDPSSEF